MKNTQAELTKTIIDLQFTYKEDIGLWTDEHKLELMYHPEDGDDSVSIWDFNCGPLLQFYINSNSPAGVKSYTEDGILIHEIEDSTTLKVLVLKWRELSSFVDKWIVD